MAGSYCGGSFLGPAEFMPLGGVSFSYGELDMLESDAPGDDLETDIQSSSSPWPKGFEGRCGFKAISWPSRPLGMGI